MNASSANSTPALDASGFQTEPPWRGRATRLHSPASAVVRLTRGNPAIRLITDFAQAEPRTIAPSPTLDDALREMVCTHVGALLVAEDELVVALITSCDVERQRPSTQCQGQATL